MKNNGSLRLASSRLQAALASLPQVGLISASLTLAASAASAQTTIASGENLFPSSSSLGALTRNAGGTALFSGNATFSASATLTNSLLPWGIVQNSGAAANNSTNGYTFATITSGNIASYTGATSMTGTGAWGGIASGGTGTINYDVNSGNNVVLGATGLNRNVNTIRYTGSGARQPGNNAGDLLTVNGLMNSGTGALTLGRNGANITNDYSFGILVGASRELVLAPMTADLVLYSFIKDGTGSPAAGAVTVAGATGSANLAGANTYTGATTVTGGTLLVSGAGSINTTSGITVNGSTAKYLHTSSVASTRTITLTRGTVDGTGTLGTVNVADNTANVITNGNGGNSTLTVGSLNFNGDATINARITSGSKAINVTGALTTTPANGTIALNIVASGFTTGVNNIIGFGSFSGSASDFTLGTVTGTNSRQTVGALSVTSGNLALTINGDKARWTGAQSGAWTTGTIGGASNWRLVTAGTATDYLSNDETVFDDSATGTTNVDITAANVAPAYVEFNNTTKNYAISSSGGFGISSGYITKSGSGSLTLGTANTYSGGTTLNTGTLVLDNASAIGSGALNIAGGSLDSTTGATLSTNNAVNLTGDVSFVGTSNLNLGNGTVTLTGERTVNVAAGTLTTGRLVNTAGGFTKSGSGVLQLNPNGAVSSLNGTLTVNGGTLGIGAQDLVSTGLAGSGTIQNGSATTRWLLVTNTTDNTFSGVLQDGGSGKLGFSKSGAGTTTLSGVNTLTDVVTVNDGTLNFSGLGSVANAAGYTIANNGVLQVSGNGQLSSGTITIASAGGAQGTNNRMDISGGSSIGGAIILAQRNEASVGSGVASVAIRSTSGANTLSGNITITTGGSQARIQSDAGSLTLSGAITTTATTARNLYLQGAGNGVASGAISDNAGNASGKINFLKEGSGAWTLSGNNTYTGTTTVSAGSLFINGSLANTVVTVASGATLGGSGTIGGATTVNGILSAGNSPGVLSFTGNLTLGSGSTSIFEINGLARGTEYDGVNVGGVLTYGGGINLVFGTPVAAGTYDLFGGSFTSQSGDFASVSLDGSVSSPVITAGTGWSLLSGGWQYDFVNATGDLTITSAIPEPSSFAAFAGLACLGLVGLRRRRA